MPTLLVKSGTLGTHPTLIMKGGKLACECCGPPRFECEFCTDSVPGVIQLTLSGFYTGSLTECTSCAADLNTTHNLTQLSPTSCTWRKIGTFTSCPGGATRTYTLSVTFGSTLLSVSCTMSHELGLGAVNWRKTLSNPHTCVGSHTVPHDSFFGGASCFINGPTPPSALVVVP